MKNEVIIDNWSITEIKDAITNEFIDDKIEFNKYNEDEILNSSNLIKLKTLATFLNDLVIRDKILVDKSIKTDWIGTNQYLDQLINENIIEFYVDDVYDEKNESVQLILESFGSPNEINEIINSESVLLKDYWNYYSGVTRRTADYLFASSKLEAIYSPHHFRSNFLKKTIFPEYNDVNLNLKHWVKNEREQIIERINQDSIIKIGTLQIAPFLILIIENSNTRDDLIKVALQLRNEYKKFRTYLSEYQMALNIGNLKKLLEHKRLLESVHNKILKSETTNKYGNFSINLCYGVLKYSKDVPLIDELLLRIGIRSSLQKLILAPASEYAIDKFLKLFELSSKKYRNPLIKELGK